MLLSKSSALNKNVIAFTKFVMIYNITNLQLLILFNQIIGNGNINY